MTLLRTALIALLLFVPLHAQGKDPSASDASAAIVPGGVAIYATLSNPSMYDAYVQSGKSDVGKVQLRDKDPSAPLGTGKPTGNITIPAFGSVELKAGGPFVLVTDLNTAPKAGDTITVTLETDGGAAIAVTAVVK
jgi:copper(I)-binding protein